MALSPQSRAGAIDATRAVVLDVDVVCWALEMAFHTKQRVSTGWSLFSLLSVVGDPSPEFDGFVFLVVRVIGS